VFAGKKSAQIREILISESAWEEMTCLFAPSLRHLANNEIDSDYFAVVSECESYGQETDAELSITEFALRAAGYVDALVESLEKALQRIAELDKDCRVYENNVKNLLERAGSAESSCAEAARILQSGERMALTRAITILQGPGISHCDGGIKPDEVNL